MSLKELKDQEDSGSKIYIDEERNKIIYKRVHVEDSKDLYGDGCTADSLQKTVLNAIKVLKSIGREEDFISVLEALSNGTLSTKKIILHLFLYIGLKLRHTQCQIRCSRTTLDFGFIVQKLSHGGACAWQDGGNRKLPSVASGPSGASATMYII